MTPLGARCPTRLMISPRTRQGRIRGRLGTRIARPGESQRDDMMGSGGAMRHGHPSNVEVIRPKDGAAPAPQEMCRTKGSDPTIG